MKKMYIRKNKSFLLSISIIIIVLIPNSIFNLTFASQRNFENANKLDSEHLDNGIPMLSINHEEKLEAIFARKLDDYTNLGYFPQYYGASLQSTYHGLYVLDALDRLDVIAITIPKRIHFGMPIRCAILIMTIPFITISSIPCSKPHAMGLSPWHF